MKENEATAYMSKFLAIFFAFWNLFSHIGSGPKNAYYFIIRFKKKNVITLLNKFLLKIFFSKIMLHISQICIFIRILTTKKLWTNFEDKAFTESAPLCRFSHRVAMLVCLWLCVCVCVRHQGVTKQKLSAPLPLTAGEKSNGATIRIGQEMWCLPYARFLIVASQIDFINYLI